MNDSPDSVKQGGQHERITELLDRLRDGLANRFTPGRSLTFGHAPPVILLLLSFIEVTSHRLHDLASAAATCMTAGKAIPATVLSRAAGETVALLRETYSAAKTASSVQGFDRLAKRLKPLVLGSRRPSHPIRSRNVLDLIDGVETVVSGFRAYYDALSEISHPNVAGNLAFYLPSPTLEPGSPIGEPAKEKLDRVNLLAGNYLELCLSLALSIRSDFDLLVPKLIRRDDNLPAAYQRRSIENAKEMLARITRDSHPELWGHLQHSLGDALFLLGEREKERSYLTEAILAHRAGLEVFHKTSYPGEWANSQRCLGAVLLELGEIDRSVETVSEGMAAQRKALQLWKKRRDPCRWAEAVSNIGAGFCAMASITGDVEYLERAEGAYNDVLEVASLDDEPVAWAAAQYNLGGIHLKRGRRPGQLEDLQEAVQFYTRSQLVYQRETMPFDWAMAEFGRAICWVEIGELSRDLEPLLAAVLALTNILEEWPVEEGEGRWLKVHRVWARALAALTTVDRRKLDEVVADLRVFAESLKASGDPRWVTLSNEITALMSEDGMSFEAARETLLSVRSSLGAGATRDRNAEAP